MSKTFLCRLLIPFLVCAALSRAQGTTYVALWSDTEDYVDPISDDSALRIANELSAMGVHGTFKIVGEKARVDGPTAAGTTTYRESTIPAFVFDASVQDVKSFIDTNHRPPSEVFVGSQTLSLADFAATLAQHVLVPGPIQVVHGKLGFEQYFSTDARRSFNWPIHPEGFAPVALLDLTRLQEWTLKPARLR